MAATSRLLTFVLLVALLTACAGTPAIAVTSTTAMTATTAPTTAPPTSTSPASTAVRSGSRVVRDTMWSDALRRSMPITVYVPPGYDSSPQQRYAVHYLLHGLGGVNSEWENYGAFSAAEQLFADPNVKPFLIVLPQGDLGYWVDQSGGPAWGAYVAHEVVAYADSSYRTVPASNARAIGGLSAGADGALQISLTYPGVFDIVAAHSPVLRPYSIAAPFYGTPEYHAAHYPPAQFASHVAAARRLRIWIDVGDHDDWISNVTALHVELLELGIAHTWQVWPGLHEPAYWAAHLPEYLPWIAEQLAAR